MRLTANSLIKVLVSAAMLADLGAHAVTTVETTQVQTAPKQDFVTLLAMADLNKQGITRPTKAQLAAEVKSIQAQRTSGMGWGAIADSRGLKLGEVVSEANRNIHADDDKRTDVDKRAENAENRKGAENSRSSETHGSKGSGSDGGGNDGGGSKGGGSSGGGSGGGHGGGKK
jgi:uncharacterized membrane protein YgcG